MRETGGVEVELHVILLGPVNPALEVLYLHLVTIHELTAEVSIDLMEVQTVVTGDEGLHELDVLTHLVNITGTTRVIAGGLNATREGFVALKADHIVGLPTMQGDLLFLELVQYGIGIDTNRCIAVFRYGISFFYQFCFHILFVFI